MDQHRLPMDGPRTTMDCPWTTMGWPWTTMGWPWTTMGWHGLSMDHHAPSMDYHGLPCTLHGQSMDHHELPWTSMEPPWSLHGPPCAGMHCPPSNANTLGYRYPPATRPHVLLNTQSTQSCCAQQRVEQQRSVPSANTAEGQLFSQEESTSAPQQRLYNCQRNVLHPLPTKHLHGGCHAAAAYSLVPHPFRPDINLSVLDVAADHARQYVRHIVAVGGPLLLALQHSLYAGAGSATYTLGDIVCHCS